MKRLNIFSNIRNTFLNYLNTNFKAYISIIFVFIVGCTLGVFFVNNSEIEQLNQIANYINDFIEQMQSIEKLNYSELFFNSFLNMLYIILALWFVGSTVIGLPIVYIIVAYKGFCLTYTISSFVSTISGLNGIFIPIISLLLQNIIYIPAIWILAVSGFQVYKSIMKDKRKENIKKEIFRHTLILIFVFILMLLGVFIETYVSSNLLFSFVKNI